MPLLRMVKIMGDWNGCVRKGVVRPTELGGVRVQIIRAK